MRIKYLAGPLIVLALPALLASQARAQTLPDDGRVVAYADSPGMRGVPMPEDKLPLATTFSELRLLVGPGDKITIVSKNQQQTTGKVQSLTPDALVVKGDGGQHTFAENDVMTIRQRRGDSLINGSIIGLVIGVALSAPVLMFGEDLRDSAYVVAPLVYGGIGAAAGAGIDAAIAGQKTIYETGGTRTTSLTRLTETGRIAVRIGFGF